VNREMWFTLQAADQLLGECYRTAKAEHDFRAAANVQAARARLSAVIAAHAGQYAHLELEGQLQLVDSGAGRRHDTPPAA